MSDIISILVASRHDKDKDHLLTALKKQNDFQIVSAEKDEVGAIIKSEQLKPSVIIIDLQPAELDELELASIIHRKSPSTSIILMSNKNQYDTKKALSAGVMGILAKEADSDEIAIAVKAVNKGGFYSSAPIIMAEKQVPKYAQLSLSPIERNIIFYIAKGLSDDKIAELLNYSAGTIRNILVDIKRKTKLKNRIQIVLYSLGCGLINIDLKELFKEDEKDLTTNRHE